jgi:pSer/pThr/pTyr-binding forkhead associated (FHA) protein
MTIKIVVKNENQNAGSFSQTLALENVLITIGSADAANVRLHGPGVASEQAVIINENDQSLFINQAKGTILNGEEIEQGFPHQLKNGDRVQIGSYHLEIELESHFAAEEMGSAANVNSLIKIDEFDNETKKKNLTEKPSHDKTNKLGAETFADILSSLRKEEDQFYFQLTEADGSKRRLIIESDETVLGWNTVNDIFSTNQETQLDLPQAIIRKDWNGVTIYPNGKEAILLNGALLEVGSRMRNGDKIIFSRFVETGTHTVNLVFCEPAALVELNAILPQELLSNALQTNQSGEITIEPGFEQQFEAENHQPKSQEIGRQATKPQSRFYFKYFVLEEIIIMIIATILTAALTYILLDFS